MVQHQQRARYGQRPNKRLKLPGAHKQGGIALPRWLAFFLRLVRLAPGAIAPAA